MTQTNGMAREMPTLAAMLEAVEKIERDTYKVPTEYKIHPDDWDELRTQLKPHMVTYSNNATLRGPEIFWLRIVLDYSAERLPHKVPNASEPPLDCRVERRCGTCKSWRKRDNYACKFNGPYGGGTDGVEGCKWMPKL